MDLKCKRECWTIDQPGTFSKITMTQMRISPWTTTQFNKLSPWRLLMSLEFSLLQMIDLKLDLPLKKVALSLCNTEASQHAMIKVVMNICRNLINITTVLEYQLPTTLTLILSTLLDMGQLRDIFNLNKINLFNTSSTSISKRLTKMGLKQAKSSLKQLQMQVFSEPENWSPVLLERTRFRSDLRTLQIS